MRLIEQREWSALVSRKMAGRDRNKFRSIFKLMTTPPQLRLWEFALREDLLDFHSIGQFIILFSNMQLAFAMAQFADEGTHRVPRSLESDVPMRKLF